MNSPKAPIIHPTDFSKLSRSAFAHALRISLAAQCKLYIAHIASREDTKEWQAFPHVRSTLAQWGLLDAGASTADIFHELGVAIAKVEIGARDPVRGLAHFLSGHPSELMVLATSGRDGMPRWLEPSIAEAMARQAQTQSLFIPGHCAGFVDLESGELRLERILIPVDHDPLPSAAISAIRHFCQLLNAEPEIRLLHIGKIAPTIDTASPSSERAPIELRTGQVVHCILQAAAEMNANLIGMATAGHHGLLDALRGSTTERVLRQAPCPVLAVPVGKRA